MPVAMLMLPPLPSSIVVPLTLDWRVLLFALSLSLGVAVVFGVLPAFRGSRVDAGGHAQGRRACLARALAAPECLRRRPDRVQRAARRARHVLPARPAPCRRRRSRLRCARRRHRHDRLVGGRRGQDPTDPTSGRPSSTASASRPPSRARRSRACPPVASKASGWARSLRMTRRARLRCSDQAGTSSTPAISRPSASPSPAGTSRRPTPLPARWSSVVSEALARRLWPGKPAIG